MIQSKEQKQNKAGDGNSKHLLKISCSEIAVVRRRVLTVIINMIEADIKVDYNRKVNNTEVERGWWKYHLRLATCISSFFSVFATVACDNLPQYSCQNYLG